MRKVQQTGPLVNSEFYPGWLDHWSEFHHTVPSSQITKTLEEMLEMNASVNIYVFHGGTNFGFTSGANAANDGSHYQADPTSYDYDAPLTEAGDPTPKFFDIRKVISKYLPLPQNIPKPVVSPKMAFGPIDMSCPIGDIFDFVRDFSGNAIMNLDPLPFEHQIISEPKGFLLYSTRVTQLATDPAVLQILGLKDRGYIFVNQVFQGILSREVSMFSLPIRVRQEDEIQVLVENQGRIGFSAAITETKGITDVVKLGIQRLYNWKHNKIPLHDPEVIQNLTYNSQCKDPRISDTRRPTFFQGTFVLDSHSEIDGDDTLADTFLLLKGWSKGFVWINGFNIGRYWPVVGPQVTLYVPKHFFNTKGEQNTIMVFELEDSPCFSNSTSCSVEFVKNHIIDAPVPQI
jgi:beta-galactosidase